MVSFVDHAVSVTVPATSANLGPGFDSLGLALSMRDELSASVAPAGLDIDVEGAGADDVPRDETHLVVRAMHAAFASMDARPPGLVLRCRNVIPHSRGLGSSSAAIVAGLALARALVAGGSLLLDDEALFQLAAELEGHPDNVAPALLGGFTISGHDDGEFFTVASSVDPRVTTVVFVPPTPVATSVARGLLPDVVRHADAAANSASTALLVAALAGRPELLLRATRDHLHQSYRAPAMPESLRLVEALRADGVAAVVSGAGPTVLAFTDAASVDSLLARCPLGWTPHHLAVEARGVLVG
ncbi:homoserine kinase [Nocardioides sp. LHG3406-4]|uniref:homoserine kinase n=1 Tax=Nocardioides sp. LHG3406-4 TaxID=2804575 RepID=UPI003CEEF9E8